MLNYKGIGFLQEDTHTRSSMRLMCFMTLIFAFFITWTIVSAHLAADTPIHQFELALIFLLFVAAFAPKAVQKFAEAQFPKNQIESIKV